MDILDGSGFWVTGDTPVVPPPPPTPSDGDGVALVAMGGYLEHRERLRARGDPWSEIADWLRRLNRQAGWIVTRDQQAKADRAAAFGDEQDIDDVSATRRRL